MNPLPSPRGRCIPPRGVAPSDVIREQLRAYRDAGLEYLVAELPRTKTEDEAVRVLEDVVRVLTAS